MPCEPHLILHKVRGEPVFDIAIRCTEEDGWGTYEDPAPWWIIPTSGHRAYPLRQWPLRYCQFALDEDDENPTYPIAQAQLERHRNLSAWEALPDHYNINSDPPPPEVPADQLLAALGLIKPKTIHRRV